MTWVNSSSVFSVIHFDLNRRLLLLLLENNRSINLGESLSIQLLLRNVHNLVLLRNLLLLYRLVLLDRYSYYHVLSISRLKSDLLLLLYLGLNLLLGNYNNLRLGLFILKLDSSLLFLHSLASSSSTFSASTYYNSSQNKNEYSSFETNSFVVSFPVVFSSILIISIMSWWKFTIFTWRIRIRVRIVF